MKIEYEDFVKLLIGTLLKETGFPAEKVYFAEKGTKFAANGDRLFVECAEHEDAREVCGFYVQELYERYQEKMNLAEITGTVLQEIRRVQRAELFNGTRKLARYESAREDLFIRLVNVERHASDLAHAVFRRMGDIALVLYMKVADMDDCITSLKIRQEYLDSWGESAETVFDTALVNTSRISPPRIYFWEKLLYDQNYAGEDFMTGEGYRKLSGSAMGNCISTSRRTNGAVAVFLPGVAKRIAETLENDLYLAFTSIHEVMVHNAREVRIEELHEVLNHTILATTQEEDYLSPQIYRYSRLTGEFSCVTKAGLPTYSNREC